MAAKLYFLACLTAVTFLFHFTNARNAPSVTSINNSTFSQNYTHVCDPSRFSYLGLNMKDFAFCDSSLPYEVRVKDLIDRMTLNEKSGQIGDIASGVPRLGLPEYIWWSEALHGVSSVGDGATFFNDVVPGATSFPTIWVVKHFFFFLFFQAVSTEARAMYNLGQAGLTFWSPNINVVRDPRWGRALETPGEDPFVVGEYGSNYVRGLQDVHGTENATDLNSRPLKVAACCKHYAAYDVDNWLGVDRYHFDAQVTEQDMKETFLRPFEMCVKEGDVTSVMCSYNKVNGIPTCLDTNLLKNTVRGEWNLHGYIVSDCDSIEVIIDDQKWLNDGPEDAVAQALKAGYSVTMGKVKEEVIDRALKNLYIVLMRLGFFDGSPHFEKLGKGDVCSDKHMELAADAAREGIVLLKNANETLPLNSRKIKTIAVVGPHANATKAMIGNYAGTPCRYTAPIDGFSKFGKVIYETGCGDVLCKNESLIFPAVRAAKKADVTILVVGLDLTVEAESLDRMNLLLPGYQNQLINQVASESKGPVILVVMSAGGVDISFARDSPNIQAIIWAGYPGQEGGHAIADVVFGRHNPGGKLPLTWFENEYTDMLPMTSMPLRPIDALGYPGRTYKFYNGSTVYPFGYGLSYTNFTYKLTSSTKSLHIDWSKSHHCRDLNYTDGSYKPGCPAILIDDLKSCDDHNVDIELEVENIGERDGKDVVMVYWSPPREIAEAPIKQLIAFKRIFVRVGESQKVSFRLNACKSFEIINYRGYSLLPSGGGKIVIGDNLVSTAIHVHFQR
ncbi:hypothetical protein BUALT_Bualt03G0030800 [Buddleja alternifolia]|uniref:Fibronectin type III-like domain-containing protein n=1 Tax=Buddleja alternifolia TaxID=168488 RepID=A0AAV6XS94_9LAMI|nr:hypothetical protein BUALT_Bualt03G0030800 [Buddleja alternifolia]